MGLNRGYEIDSKLLVRLHKAGLSQPRGTGGLRLWRHVQLHPGRGLRRGLGASDDPSGLPEVGTIFVNCVSNLLATCCIDAKLKAVRCCAWLVGQVEPTTAVQEVKGGYAAWTHLGLEVQGCVNPV